jgi:hypothetical protein
LTTDLLDDKASGLRCLVECNGSGVDIVLRARDAPAGETDIARQAVKEYWKKRYVSPH